MDWLEFFSTLLTAIIPAAISYLVARNQCKNDLKKVAEENKADIERLMKQHEINIEALREQHKMEMDALKQQHEYAMQLMQKEYELKNAEKKEEMVNDNALKIAADIVKLGMVDLNSSKKTVQNLSNLRDSLNKLNDNT